MIAANQLVFISKRTNEQSKGSHFDNIFPLAGSHCFRGKAPWLAFNFIKLMLPFRKAWAHSGPATQHLPTAGNVEPPLAQTSMLSAFSSMFSSYYSTEKNGENHSIFRIFSVASVLGTVTSRCHSSLWCASHGTGPRFRDRGHFLSSLALFFKDGFPWLPPWRKHWSVWKYIKFTQNSFCFVWTMFYENIVLQTWFFFFVTSMQ